MLATLSYIDTQDDNPLSADSFGLNELSEIDTVVKLVQEAVELELEEIETDPLPKKSQHPTTDLVRSYLQEIGRVPLLRKDEEVSKAQQIQRYIRLLEVQTTGVSKADPAIQRLVELRDAHDHLASQLGHRPSLARWAAVVQMDVSELKLALILGKRHWAEVAGITVKDLEQIQKAGLQAKEQMIKANLRLVVSVAKKYQNRGLELLDLIQEGTLGLERAVEKFDPTKGYRFSTYAYWWIRQGITRAIATQSRTIRLPVHITEKLNKIKKVQRKISQEKGRTATVEEIAKELATTPYQVREVLQRVPRSVSLEIKVGKERDTELGDLLETENPSPEDILIRESLQRELQALLTELTTREQDVIQLRFGLKDGKSHSLADIGRILSLSRERVRQIEAKAMQKLRQPKRRNQMRDYFESLD